MTLNRSLTLSSDDGGEILNEEESTNSQSMKRLKGLLVGGMLKDIGIAG